MPFHKIPLGDWTEEDTLEWLKYVGLGHFKEQFKGREKNIAVFKLFSTCFKFLIPHLYY